MLVINVNGSSYTNVTENTLFGLFCGSELTPHKDFPPISVKIKDTIVIPNKTIPTSGYIKLEMSEINCFPYTDDFAKRCGLHVYEVVTHYRYSVVCSVFNQGKKHTVCFGFDNEEWFSGLVTFITAMEIYLPEIVCFSNSKGNLTLVNIPNSTIHMNLEHDSQSYVCKSQIVVMRGSTKYNFKSKDVYGFHFEDLKSQLIKVFGFLPEKLMPMSNDVYQYVDAYLHVASPLRKKM